MKIFQKFSAEGVNAFKEVGGRALCDCSTIGGNIDIIKTKQLSEKTGVHIICATGFYTPNSRPEKYVGVTDVSVLAEAMKDEIANGINGSGCRPGFLKSAIATLTESGEIHEAEIATLRACAQISNETGMSMQVHTQRPLSHEQIYQTAKMLIEKCGMQPDRIVFCHLDKTLTNHINFGKLLTDDSVSRSINTDLLEQLCDLGINVGLDTWGAPQESMGYVLPDDLDRAKGLIHLINKGYASQVVLGHDMAMKFYSVSYGNYGYTRFPTLLPRLFHMLQMDQSVIKTLTVDNPARILAY